MMSDTVTVLTGWKAIAAFLRRDERTAMRWAAERGLPVRRVPGGKRGPVYAVPSEITEWLARDAATGDSGVAEPVAAPDIVAADAPAAIADEPGEVPRRHSRVILTIAAALAGAAATALVAGSGLLPSTPNPVACSHPVPAGR